MIEEKSNKKEHQTIIIKQNSDSNSAGIAGFVLAILSWPLSCFPILGSVLWLLGVLFSIIGLFKRPRGMAIAGLVISFIGLILILLVVFGIFGAAMFSESLDQF